LLEIDTRAQRVSDARAFVGSPILRRFHQLDERLAGVHGLVLGQDRARVRLHAYRPLRHPNDGGWTSLRTPATLDICAGLPQRVGARARRTAAIRAVNVGMDCGALRQAGLGVARVRYTGPFSDENQSLGRQRLKLGVDIPASLAYVH